jgi:hypothetical protein
MLHFRYRSANVTDVQYPLVLPLGRCWPTFLLGRREGALAGTDPQNQRGAAAPRGTRSAADAPPMGEDRGGDARGELAEGERRRDVPTAPRGYRQSRVRERAR